MPDMQSAEIAEVAAALAEAQGEIKAATKDSTNPHFGNRYADLASVWEACRASLSKRGLSVVQQPIPTEGGERLRTLLLHKSGQWIASECALLGNLSDMQKYGSALTYARRYGLAAMVGVVADVDDDGNKASEPGKRTGKSTPNTREEARNAEIKSLWLALERIEAIKPDDEKDAKLAVAYRYCGWVLQQTVDSLSRLPISDLSNCREKIGKLRRKLTDVELLQPETPMDAV